MAWRPSGVLLPGLGVGEGQAMKSVLVVSSHRPRHWVFFELPRQTHGEADELSNLRTQRLTNISSRRGALRIWSIS